MYGDDGPEDDYMTSEQACEAGWMMPDEVDELRDLFKHIDWPPDGEMTKHHAALVLIEMALNSRPLQADSPEAKRFEWARAKLNRLRP